MIMKTEKSWRAKVRPWLIALNAIHKKKSEKKKEPESESEGKETELCLNQVMVI